MGKSVPARDLNPPRGRSSRPPSADRRWAHAWLTCPDPLVQVLQPATPRSRTCHRRLQGKPKSRLVLAVGGDMYQLRIASLQHWRIAWTSGLHHVRYAGAPRTAAHDAAMSPPNYAREILSLALPLPCGFNGPIPRKFGRAEIQTLPNFLGAGRAFLPL